MRLNRIITSLMLTSFVLAAQPQQQMEAAKAAYQQGDYVKAAELWQALALDGNTTAQFELAKLYSLGHGVEQDALQAAYWLEQAASNSTDFAESARARQDIVQGVAELREAEQGEANAAQRSEPEIQAPVDTPATAVATTAAAETSTTATTAATPVGQTAVLAVKAPELPVLTSAEAKFDTGLRAFSRQNYAEAYSHWYPLAQAGVVDAQFNLAALYANGHGVAVDDSAATAWFNAAAEQGMAQAQYQLALAHANGKGVAQDDALAVYWYQSGRAATCTGPI